MDAIDELIPLKVFGKRLGKTGEAIYRWKTHGILNRNTQERVFCEMTRLTNGNWSITDAQYRAFLDKINEKL